MFRQQEISMERIAQPVELKSVLALCLVVALVFGCATPSSKPDLTDSVITVPTSLEAGMQIPATVPRTKAVSGLLQQARQSSARGRYIDAAAALERALRIEPKNALLWSELAQVYKRQKQFGQAEQLAIKSNRYTSQDRNLEINNWLLIRDIRRAQGSVAATQAAEFELQRLHMGPGEK